jgi:hypothetical protein
MDQTSTKKNPGAKAVVRGLTLLLLSASPALLAASHTWSGASPANGNWSTAANWSAGGAPVNGESSVTLDFPAVAARKAGMVNDLTGLNVTSISFADTAYSVGGNAINMAGAISTISVTAGAFGTNSVAINLDVVLTGTAAFFQSGNDSGVGNVYGLSFYGTISGAGGKDVHTGSLVGPSGEVLFAHANTYLGVTYVDSGYLILDDAAGLGSPVAGTIVGSGGTLSLNRVDSAPWTLGETLFVGGSGANGNAALQWQDLTWTAPITLTADATIKTDGIVNFNGVISGNFALHIRASNISGTSECTLTQANTYSQPTQIEYGTVLVTGSQPASAFTLQGYSSSDRSRLRGTGTVGAVSVEPGGSETKTIAPGTTLTTGTLHTGNFSLNDPPNPGAGYAGNHGVLSVRLNGTGAGAWDQVAVTGTVDLGFATLDVVQWFTPAVGNSWTIVSNDATDAVVGFLRVGGAPVVQGGTFVAGGRTFQMDYQGGDGNDVVITLTSTTPVSLQSFEIE